MSRSLYNFLAVLLTANMLLVLADVTLLSHRSDVGGSTCCCGLDGGANCPCFEGGATCCTRQAPGVCSLVQAPCSPLSSADGVIALKITATLNRALESAPAEDKDRFPHFSTPHTLSAFSASVFHPPEVLPV
ncbi:MAG: hypothetical protein KF749_16060 [Bacteroidetes bacterium]|nr:hypothetical protein [Bacteroidota bacterium]MCW5894169.1 hypothetical protein [Bacteroidota bacterium]